jgi:hypothetical protein
MKTDKFDVNTLRIATPCPMSWDQMAGDDRARHCLKCGLNVFNISEMTPIQVTELVRQTEGRFCAKLYRRADGTVLTRDCPVGVRTRRQRIARMATAALAAVMSAFSFSFAQKDAKDKIDGAKLNPAVSSEKGDALRLLGTMMDPNGAVVPGVKLILRERSKNIELNTVSDSEGKYSFPLMASGVYELTAKAPGFKKQRVENILIKTGTKTELNVELSIDGDAVFIGVVAADSLIEMTPEIKTVLTRETLDRIPGRRLPF